MPIEIRELIIRAVVGTHKDDEKKDNANSTCEENKKMQETQNAIDMMSEIIKEEKER